MCHLSGFMVLNGIYVIVGSAIYHLKETKDGARKILGHIFYRFQGKAQTKRIHSKTKNTNVAAH